MCACMREQASLESPTGYNFESSVAAHDVMNIII